MNFKQFKNEMLIQAISQGKLLCEMSTLEDIKKEPEQIRKNISTILSILIETEEFLKEISASHASSSDN